MQYIESTEILKMNASTEQGKKLVLKMKADVDWFNKNFKDDPAILSGWGHEYFCSKDGSFLIFDLEKPHHHCCPICNNVSNAANYDAAWVYMYRYQALMSALEAATLFLIENKVEYISHFKRIISFYSDHYEEFCVHGKGPTTSGNGKIMPQALNEAIFLTKVVSGLELLKGFLDKKFVSSVVNKLLIPGAYFVNAQKKIIHNIPCWINAAVGTVGLYTDNSDLIQKAFEAPLGMFDQVRQGVTNNFFWYEGSIHYNFFTIESFMNLLMLAQVYKKEIPQDVRKIVYQMMISPCKIAFSNSILPNPNDGWPNLNLKTYTYLYEMAAKIFESDELRNILANIYAQPIQRTPLPMSSPIYSNDYCMEWLWFTTQPVKSAPLAMWNKSINFPASNYSMLRNKHCEVFVKYGHCSSSHAHPDKMNIEVSAYNTIISRDLSNCGYASRLCNEYHRTSVAHNTVVVNGETHPTTNLGNCVNFDETVPNIEVYSKNAYDKVDFQRNLTVTANGFSDKFSTVSNEIQVYDFFFHLEGTFATDYEFVAADLGFNKNGYQHLQDVKKLQGDYNSITISWNFKNGVMGLQQIHLENMELYLCKSYDNPVNQLRNTMILRTKSKNATFKQSWGFCKKSEEN